MRKSQSLFRIISITVFCITMMLVIIDRNVYIINKASTVAQATCSIAVAYGSTSNAGLSACGTTACSPIPPTNLSKTDTYNVTFSGESQKSVQPTVAGGCCQYQPHCWGGITNLTPNENAGSAKLRFEIIPAFIQQGGDATTQTVCMSRPSTFLEVYPKCANLTCYNCTECPSSSMCDIAQGPCEPPYQNFCTAGGDYTCYWDYQSCSCQGDGCGSSPIIIDVLGDGFNLTNYNDGVSFDLNSDGAPEKYSWTSVNSDDAWLALDRNNNGVIDNGGELFGNFTSQPQQPSGYARNGFNALKEFDKSTNGGNEDNKISFEDAIFQTLRLWQDRNHNGISESNELSSLSQVGVKWIDLDYKESKKTDTYGNRFLYKAKIKDTKEANIGRKVYDVYLLRN